MEGRRMTKKTCSECHRDIIPRYRWNKSTPEEKKAMQDADIRASYGKGICTACAMWIRRGRPERRRFTPEEMTDLFKTHDPGPGSGLTKNQRLTLVGEKIGRKPETMRRAARVYQWNL